MVVGIYENRGALYLALRYEGVDLDIPWARDTLHSLYLLWGRPVYIETIVDGDEHMLYGYGPDGNVRKMLDEGEAVLAEEQ
jgi:stage V sporulation protein R